MPKILKDTQNKKCRFCDEPVLPLKEVCRNHIQGKKPSDYYFTEKEII